MFTHGHSAGARRLVTTCSIARGAARFRSASIDVSESDTLSRMTRRREFLKVAAAAGGAALAAKVPMLARAAESLAPPPHATLRILILGGTGYIGPHLVKHA